LLYPTAYISAAGFHSCVHGCDTDSSLVTLTLTAH
jgi:hypothetical protein